MRLLLALAAIFTVLAIKHATAADYDLVVCKPNTPCFVKYRFDISTACDLDLWSVANIMPKGTKTRCVPVKDTRAARR